MEVFLANTCESLTGSLGRGFGYYLRSTKKGRYFGQRSKHSVPHDGHWRFILTCADLAQKHLYLSDIRVSHQELSEALSEAGLPLSGAPGVRPEKIYSASDILTLKTTFSL